MRNIISIASGIGGLDLAVRLALEDARTVCYIEREAFAVARLVELMRAQVLDDAPVWSDVRTFEGRAWCDIVEGVIGGYPCQPFSIAGHQHGKNDKRNLTEHVIRIIEEVRPRWCFFENVGAHLRLGFREVKFELENLHYRVEAGLFSAAEVGAPHRRERLFIFAVSDNPSEGESHFTCGNTRRKGKWETQKQLSTGTGHGFDGRTLATRDRVSTGNSVTVSSTCELEDSDSRPSVIGQIERRNAKPCKVAQSDTRMADAILKRDEWRDNGHSTRRGERLQSEIETARPDGELVNRTGERLEGCEQIQDEQIKQCARVGNECGSALEYFPPRPDEHDRWAKAIEEFPEIEPAVRGVADGFSHRLYPLEFREERLRALGNAVVPLTGAFAFRVLSERLGIRWNE